MVYPTWCGRGELKVFGQAFYKKLAERETASRGLEFLRKQRRKGEKSPTGTFLGGGLRCRVGRWSPVATVQRRPKRELRPVAGRVPPARSDPFVNPFKGYPLSQRCALPALPEGEPSLAFSLGCHIFDHHLQGRKLKIPGGVVKGGASPLWNESIEYNPPPAPARQHISPWYGRGRGAGGGYRKFHPCARRGQGVGLRKARHLSALPVGAPAYRPGGACGRRPWLASVAAAPLFKVVELRSTPRKLFIKSLTKNF